MWVRVLAALLEDLFGRAAMSGSSQAPVAPVPSNPRVLFRPPAVRCLYPHRGMHAYTYAKTNPEMLLKREERAYWLGEREGGDG